MPLKAVLIIEILLTLSALKISLALLFRKVLNEKVWALIHIILDI
jgi:hypothetical protein